MRISEIISESVEQGVSEGSLNEFAPGDGGDGGDDRTYEYEVYQCNPNDQFDWIGGPLYQSDNMAKVHSVAYEMWKKHPDKAFMIWQERSQGSRGGYGIKDDEQGLAEAELDEAKRKRKVKSKRRSSSPNRSPVPRFYGAWGFGGEGEGDGGGE